MAQDISELDPQINSPGTQCVKRKVLVSNILIGSFITIGNIVLPSFFWGMGPSSILWPFLPCFLSGVLLAEIGIIGTYAAFSNEFYVVRWAWAFVAAFTCAMFLYIGIDIAEGASRMKSELGLVATAIALAGILEICCIASFGSWITGFRFVEAEPPNSSSPSKKFELVFLFRFMIAIALIMFLVRFFPAFRIDSNFLFSNAFRLLVVFSLYIPFCLVLIASTLAATMTVEYRNRGRYALLLELVFGPPLIVAAVQIMSGERMNLNWPQWWPTMAYYLGFVSSLLVVFRLWRFAGLRLSR